MEYLERSIMVFDPSYVKPIYVVQGSNMFEIRITITDWNIPADADVYWQVATKTKGELNSASLAGNTIYINPYKTTFSEAGKGYLQVRIESDGKLLVSFSIDVYIQPDRVTTPTEGSNSDVIRVLVNQYVEEATEGLIDQVEAEVQRVIESIPSDYTELESRVDDLENSQGGGLTEEVKQALLACFAKVAWIDEDGQTYYDALEEALYAITEISVSPSALSFGTLNSTQQLTGTTTPTGGTITWTSSSTSVATVDSTGLVTSVGYGTATITASCQGYTATCAVTIAQATVTSISAVYTQSGTVYAGDSLDSLKSDLVVTANWSNGTTSTVDSADYTLSGTLSEGTSTITVSYSGKTTTVNVTVSALTVQVELGSIDSSGVETASTSRARTLAIPIDLSVKPIGSSVTMNIVGISSLGGQLTANTARLASQRIPVTGGSSISVSVASGYYIKVFTYKATSGLTGNGIGNLTSNSVSGTAPSDAIYVRIVVKKSDNSNMAESDITNLSLTINGTSYSTVQGLVGDANISSNALINGVNGYYSVRIYDSNDTHISQSNYNNYSADGTTTEFSGLSTLATKLKVVFRENTSSTPPDITSLSGTITIDGKVYQLIYS